MSNVEQRNECLEEIYWQLYLNQHGLCFYCQRAMRLPPTEPRVTGSRLHPRRITREHLIPRTHGGTDDPDNVVGACSRCNSQRGSEIPWTEFLALKLQQAWTPK